MVKRLTEEEEYMAYLLYTDPDTSYTQRDIANLLKASQSLVSSAIRNVEDRRRYQSLYLELNKARKRIEQEKLDNNRFKKAYLESYPLPPYLNIINPVTGKRKTFSVDDVDDIEKYKMTLQLKDYIGNEVHEARIGYYIMGENNDNVPEMKNIFEKAKKKFKDYPYLFE